MSSSTSLGASSASEATSLGNSSSANTSYSDTTAQNDSGGSVDFSLSLPNPLRHVPNPISLLRRQPDIRSPTDYDIDALFKGGSNSLVAKAVGGAEGTRTPDGGYTSAYRGHTDPGNGVWNLGTFSYQHGAASPEEADRKQLRRLRQQVSAIQHRAAQAGITLNLTEVLNGIDLANQSPLAALGEPGYAEWMAEAQRRGLRGEEAILWARVKGYWDVRRGRWNAPGLGNTEPLIRRDQARRMGAIARAIAAHGSSGDITDSAPMPPSSQQSASEPAAAPQEASPSQSTSSNRSDDVLLSF